MSSEHVKKHISKIEHVPEYIFFLAGGYY